MSILISTNLNLPAPAYLDKRIGQALSVNDLRNWDFTATPIPVGFEVCVEGKWYAYQGQGEGIVADTVTGYFKERGGINIVQETGSSTTNVMSQGAVTEALYSQNDLIQQLVERVGIIFELEKVDVTDSDGSIATNGGELYERGSNVVPYFAWKAYYNNREVTPGRESSDGIDVSYDPTISYIEKDSNADWSTPQRASGTIIYPSPGDEDKYVTKFQSSAPISNDTIFTVNVKYGTGVNQLSATLTIEYTFVNRKYWGYTNNTSVDVSDILESFLDEVNTGGEINSILGSELSLSRELPLTKFNCSTKSDGSTEISEGVFPIYIVPSDIYGSDEIRVLVGNIEANTYDIFSGSSEGGTINYRVILFNVKQRGILNIEVKNYE